MVSVFKQHQRVGLASVVTQWYKVWRVASVMPSMSSSILSTQNSSQLSHGVSRLAV